MLSISLSIPPPVYQILEATPPDDIPSSGFILPLQCPVPDVCSISAVEVGGLPATFIWDYCPQVSPNELHCSEGLAVLMSTVTTERFETSVYIPSCLSLQLCCLLPQLYL